MRLARLVLWWLAMLCLIEGAQAKEVQCRSGLYCPAGSVCLAGGTCGMVGPTKCPAGWVADHSLGPEGCRYAAGSPPRHTHLPQVQFETGSCYSDEFMSGDGRCFPKAVRKLCGYGKGVWCMKGKMCGEQGTGMCYSISESAGRQKPRGQNEEASAEFCGLSLGKKLAACSGSDEKCACVTVRNNCPYPVSVRARLSGVKGSGLISTNVNGGRTDSLCATRDSSQQVEYLGWKPWAGYPKKGQPRPKGN